MNNGDTLLEVGAGSALENLGLHNPWHNPGALPPLGLQTGATPSGKSLRGLEPPEWASNPKAKKGTTTSEHGTDPPALAETCGGTFIDGQQAEAQSPASRSGQTIMGSSSVVVRSSDLGNQIGRMYFRSDPVKYCQTQRKRCNVRGRMQVSESAEARAHMRKTMGSWWLAHQSLIFTRVESLFIGIL